MCFCDRLSPEKFLKKTIENGSFADLSFEIDAFSIFSLLNKWRKKELVAISTYVSRFKIHASCSFYISPV